jgi:hypothetical protein
MKFICLIFLTFLSQLSLATDQNKSQMLEEVMLQAGVESYGKRQLIQANIICKNNRQKIFFCFLTAGTEFNSIHAEYFNEEANYISNILKSFGVHPEGRRLRQEGSFNCRIQKSQKTGQRVCELEVYDDIY